MKYFENAKIGSLFSEKILFQFDHAPILVVCVNEKMERYLCLCTDNIVNETWMLTRVNENQLMKLIKDEITVYRVFESSLHEIFLVERDGLEYTYKEYCFSDIPEDELPDKEEKLENPYLNEYFSFLEQQWKEKSPFLNAKDVARFFISLDEDRRYFNKELIRVNGHSSYEGNIRLNKLVHLAHNIYGAMKESLLVNAEFYAYANGAVVLEIQREYRHLLEEERVFHAPFSEDVCFFLKFIYEEFKDVPIKELIRFDHEDPEWKQKKPTAENPRQKMDSALYMDVYKKMYHDVIKKYERQFLET